MPLIQLGKAKIEAKPESTREAYRKRKEGSSYKCHCAHCRNFHAAQELVYTADVLRLIAPLGVDPPIREAEIFHNCRLESGLHLYGGWFHVVGELLSGDAKRKVGKNTAWTYDLEKVNEHFGIGATAQRDLVPEAFRGFALVQIEFLAEAPWVLTESWE